MNKQGFTLAEVLLTMGIIGVVAAVTVPSLTGSTNSKQLQAQFNNAHSLLSQATYTVVGQKGPGKYMQPTQTQMQTDKVVAITTLRNLLIYFLSN